MAGEDLKFGFLLQEATSHIGSQYNHYSVGLSGAKGWCMGYTAFGRKVRFFYPKAYLLQ